MTTAETQCHYILAIRLRPAGIISEWWPGSDRNSRPASSESAYEITDAQEIARIYAARAALAVERAAPLLLAAADAALMALSDLSTARAKGYVPVAITQLTAAIAIARPQATGEGT